MILMRNPAARMRLGFDVEIDRGRRSGAPEIYPSHLPMANAILVSARGVKVATASAE